MVLSTSRGRGGRRRALPGDAQAGSASIEFALTLPFVVLAIALVLHAAVFGADVVAAHAVALQAARVASTSDDKAVEEAVAHAAGARPVDLDVDPPAGRRAAGDLVAATVRLRSAAFGAFGATVWVPARVTMRVEAP